MASGLVGMEEPYHEQRIAPGRPHPQYDLSHKMMVTLECHHFIGFAASTAIIRLSSRAARACIHSL
jgi:hypothetical protein